MHHFFHFKYIRPNVRYTSVANNPEIANRFRYGTFVHIRLQHKNIELYDFVPPGIQNRMGNLENIFIRPENEHQLRYSNAQLINFKTRL